MGPDVVGGIRVRIALRRGLRVDPLVAQWMFGHRCLLLCWCRGSVAAVLIIERPWLLRVNGVCGNLWPGLAFCAGLGVH
jgi:hypothetical protein